jgi:hypothetical protein
MIDRAHDLPNSKQAEILRISSNYFSFFVLVPPASKTSMNSVERESIFSSGFALTA